MTTPPLKIVADLSEVRELGLLGAADGDYWRDRLVDEGVRPRDVDGAATLLVTAMEGRFHGVRFRELSVCVLLAASPDEADDAAFLVQAFNSSRFFACCERFFFHTPYDAAALDFRLEPAPRVVLHASDGGRWEFGWPDEGAERSARSRGPGGWRGRVRLPARRRNGASAQRWFQAILEGETETYEVAANDVARIEPARPVGLLHDLATSRFAPRQWIIRRAARHAKSKTYRDG